MHLKPNTLRIGSRICAIGLAKASHLNGLKGTIACAQGERWGILFDNDVSKAVLPQNLRLKPQPATHTDTDMQIETAQAMMRLQLATYWMESQPGVQGRREIAYRIKLAHQVLACEGRLVIKCAEPRELPDDGADAYDVLLMKMKNIMRCHGSGTVDFLAMSRMSPRHDEGDPQTQPFVEWLVSGLCAECQEKTFIV